MKNMGQIVMYSRKSKFTGKGESIENQIEMSKQYVKLHFGEEPANSVLFDSDYEYEFPKTPAEIGGITSKRDEKENFDATPEGGDSEPLRGYSK